MHNPTVKRALISVSDKTGLIEFAQALTALDIEIISTGGTSRQLRDHGITVTDVSDLTQFPELMDGRLKTLHPMVHGAILGKRDAHAQIASEFGIEWIDLVVVNLYPFAAVTENPLCTLDEAIENIDIGGPTMIRAAAKNMQDVTVVVDHQDYPYIINQLQQTGGLALTQRQSLAQKAFAHTAEYDQRIQAYLQHALYSDSPLPEIQALNLSKELSLRYGENPDQQACAYRLNGQKSAILDAQQHQGKVLSYNNIADADAAYHCVRQFDKTACVIVKHANPCGVALGCTSEEAFQRAFAADSTSAFGGIIALNTPCDGLTARRMTDAFFEVIIAPAFSQEALDQLANKPNIRLLTVDFDLAMDDLHYQHVGGALLCQTRMTGQFELTSLKKVTQALPTAEEMDNLHFAWQVVTQVKSNAIVISKAGQTLGIGAGQVSRIDAVELAVKKAGPDAKGASLASDAFFPFKDSIDTLAHAGVTSIIQPGGSIRDDEVIAACDQHGIAMVFTGHRCFRH